MSSSVLREAGTKLGHVTFPSLHPSLFKGSPSPHNVPSNSCQTLVLHICNLLHSQTMYKQKHEVSGKARQSHLGENQAGFRRRKHCLLLWQLLLHIIAYPPGRRESKFKCLKVQQYKEMQALRNGLLVNLRLIKMSSDLPASPSPTVKTVEAARTV